MERFPKKTALPYYYQVSMCTGHAPLTLEKRLLIATALHLRYFHVSHPIAGGDKKEKKNILYIGFHPHWQLNKYFLPGINMGENERVEICKAKKYKV